MEIPTYDEFTLPLLQTLSRHEQGLRARDAYVAVADLVGLSPAQRNQLLPSQSQRVYENRIGWAQDRLKRAGLTHSPRWGVWQITDDGRNFLARFPNRIPDDELKRLTDAWRTSPSDKPTNSIKPPEDSGTRASPYERIDEAVGEIHESLSRELLEMIGRSSPEFFEDLVLDVLHAIGYGGSREELERVGGSGDGGVDGIIALDRLGLEKVYVQAKRWSSNVGRPEIQGFFGALAGKRARKGVFITTSKFSREAIEYSQNVSDSIVLIDGQTLASLMIEFGVGITVHRTIKIAKIDSDYFDGT